MDFDLTDTGAALASLPPKPPAAPAKWNAWSTPLRAVAAGAGEVASSIAESIAGAAQVEAASGAYSARGMFSTQSPRERQEADRQRARIAAEGVDTSSEVATSLRNASRDYRPDPATAGVAENLTFELFRALPKAVGAVAAGGPVVGATLFGVDEAMRTADDLQRAGVDPATRMDVASISGVAAAAGVLVPGAGATIPQTVGLVLASGPATFMAQQAASREILARANYAKLSQQFDPLDPVGLAVSTLLPAAFGAWAMRGALRAKPAAAGGAADPAAAPVPRPAEPAATPEQLDALMTHNLTLRQDVHDATAPAQALERMGVKPGDEAPRPAETMTAEAAPVDPAAARPAQADGTAAMDMAARRLQELQQAAPDMPVRTTEDGQPVTIRQEMERIAREVAEGTDDSLGAADADLVRVAAECALSTAAL